MKDYQLKNLVFDISRALNGEESGPRTESIAWQLSAADAWLVLDEIADQTGYIIFSHKRNDSYYAWLRGGGKGLKITGNSPKSAVVRLLARLENFSRGERDDELEAIIRAKLERRKEASAKTAG